MRKRFRAEKGPLPYGRGSAGNTLLPVAAGEGWRARRLSRVTFALCVIAACAGAARGEGPISIEALNQLRPKWEALRGTTLQVEGRCLGFSESRLKMTKCDLVFVLETGLPVPSEKPKNVELTGRFETRETKLVFVVTRMKPQLSDSETVSLRRAGIDTSQPQQWYDLAAWTAARAGFYDDKELAAEALDLSEKGLLTEYRQVPADGYNALYRLADKVRTLKLPDRLRMRLIHDAARRELAAAGRRNPPDYRVVSTHVLERLPGSSRPVPLDAAAMELKDRYQADSLAAYDAADDARRQTLHRLLYTEAALAQIETGATEDGSNGFRVAAEIEQTLPEFTELAEQYRTREIDFQIGRAEALSREQLLVLAKRLEDRDQAVRAEEVKRRWLTGREASFNERGARGRIDLAEEYLSLVGDRERAVEILIDVHRKHEGADFAAKRLVDLGYHADADGNWSPAPDAPVDDPLGDVIRAGKLRRGMTDDQVRAALGQRPATVQRFASRGGVSELWVFPDLGVSVLLSRRQRDEPRVVVDFSSLPADEPP